MQADHWIQAFPDITVAVIGDFCVDAYLVLDDTLSEISLETGLGTRSVRECRIEPGGAANVAKNLAVLGVGRVRVFGLIGPDLFGREIVRQLTALGIDTAGLIIQDTTWSTNTFMKPYRDLCEEPRMDFGNFNHPDRTATGEVLRRFVAALPTCQAVIINQQLLAGISVPWFREAVAALIARHPGLPFLVDSRAYSDEFAGALRKLNLREAAAVLRWESPSATADDDYVRKVADNLAQRWGRPFFLTRGERGLAVHGPHGLELIPGIHTCGPVDPVGAGDALIAGTAACLGAGADPYAAAHFGNGCAAVTVRQRFTTGSPFPGEVCQTTDDPDYIYHPDLADDPRRAVYYPGTEIELIALNRRPFPTHVVFDHDGTISTLREGWEIAMRQTMIAAVTGGREAELPLALYTTIEAEVARLIEDTTGVRTIEQMRELCRLVGHFGIVAPADIRTAEEYKQDYLARLKERIERRIAGITAGIHTPEDYTIKGVFAFLKELRRRGATLYLASGTDVDDVRREAHLLGYATLFNGGIFGAEDTADIDPKRMVLKTILEKIDGDCAGAVAVFGDGPVEIREARKRDALAVGVCSDEVRRYGRNPHKRGRLVRAGADIIIPDFADRRSLYEALGWEVSDGQ